MAHKPKHSLLTVLIDDRGGRVFDGEGQQIGRLPEAEAGPERRLAWAAALRSLAKPGSQVQLLLAHSSLESRCQDAPFLNQREQRDVAARLAAAQRPGGDLIHASALDTDAHSESGYVLWIAMLSRQEMHDWCGAIEDAKLSLVFATPLNRALLQGLDGLSNQPPDRILLVLGLDHTAHLFIFRGRSMQIVRAFQLPEEEEDADELLFGEVNRLLQFFKQKNRHVSFESLLLAGAESVSTPLQNRLKSALKLSTTVLAPEVWPVLERGLRIERGRSDGLNLVPMEVQEALRLRLFKGVVWFSAVAMITLLGLASLFLLKQEQEMKAQTQVMETLLAQRQVQVAEDEATLKARLPLVRLRLAEKRQTEARQAVARIGAALFEVPEGIQLEKVEITELPGGAPGHRFLVSGLAMTGQVFSVGPLAQYLHTLSSQPGFKLAPVREVHVSDRMDEEKGKLDQRAITRFTLEGTAP